MIDAPQEPAPGRLRIVLLAAVTVDGKMARNRAQLSSWTSPEDKKIFVGESKQAGVIILGDNTFKTLPKPLPGRLHIVLTRHPEGKPEIPGVVEFTSAEPEEIVTSLLARGYTSAVLGGGAQINTLFLTHDLVDEIWLTVEPFIFGQGIDMFEGVSFDRRLKLISLEQINDDAFIARYTLR